MKRKESRLFALLVKNYLLFTLVLLFLAGGIYWLWERQFDRLLNPVHWDALVTDPALEQEQYPALEEYLSGAGNGFSVVDETKRAVPGRHDAPAPDPRGAGLRGRIHERRISGGVSRGGGRPGALPGTAHPACGRTAAPRSPGTWRWTGPTGFCRGR